VLEGISTLFRGRKCEKCVDNCSHCVIDTDTVKCNDGSCNVGYYYLDGECAKCGDNCLKCTDADNCLADGCD
jgi:hypothetical protein